MASTEHTGTTWRVVWRQDGIKQRETFGSARAAEKFHALVEAHGNRWPDGWIPRHGFVNQPVELPTFTEWAARTVASRSRANRRTRHDYQRDVDRHLTEPFGAMRLDQITREHVGLWLNAISGTLAPKTVENIHGTASTIMTAAVEAGLISRNPFRGALASIPNVKHEEMVFLSRSEFDTLQRYVSDPYRPLVELLGMTGLRWSEATALRVGDVDLLARRLTVVQAWKRTPENYYELGEPKSRRSRRTLTIPQSLALTLAPLVAGRADDELLFVTRYGRPVRHANFRQRVWLPAVRGMQRCDTHKDADAPCRCLGTVAKSPRIHDLRHSHASWLIAARVPLPAIQRRLGHESITTTIDRYGHLAPELDDEISAALDVPVPDLTPTLT